MPTHWASKEFEPRYVFDENNALPFPVPYIRHCRMMRRHHSELEASVVVYGDPVDAENYTEATRLAGFKTHKATSESDLVGRIRANRSILMSVILKNELSQKAELALLFAQFYSFPLRTLRTFKPIISDQSANLSADTLYYHTKPLANTHKAWREAYHTSKLFAIHNEFADPINDFPADLLKRLVGAHHLR